MLDGRMLDARMLDSRRADKNVAVQRPACGRAAPSCRGDSRLFVVGLPIPKIRCYIGVAFPACATPIGIIR
jgi:hypothetical protein